MKKYCIVKLYNFSFNFSEKEEQSVPDEGIDQVRFLNYNFGITFFFHDTIIQWFLKSTWQSGYCVYL